MKIKIVSVGKIKENYLKTGINEYKTRINPYCKIEEIELKDEPVLSDTPAEIEKAKNLEGERILKAVKDDRVVIALDLNKEEMDSIQFSSYLYTNLEKGGGNITFVIGGSYGLSDSVKERVDDSLSLSKLTYLHTMTRLILLEQIYRAFKIHNNEVYHK
ncbi:MAG: 23S rRNA (pseudouridine(1915)-N(3))-methyltransferase RlmH [Coprobacillus sp.]|nr:23S rRNA (pseudouridine(1915)-N(3))-methyltransferase RlmH [Coprobacillus sp.]